MTLRAPWLALPATERSVIDLRRCLSSVRRSVPRSDAVGIGSVSGHTRNGVLEDHSWFSPVPSTGLETLCLSRCVLEEPDRKWIDALADLPSKGALGD